MKLTRKDFFRGLALATISAPVVIKALGGGQEATAQGESAKVIIGRVVCLLLSFLRVCLLG